MKVSTVEVIDGGIGYTRPPQVEFSCGTASAVAVLEGSRVWRILVMQRGEYTGKAPTVRLTGGGGGRDAKAKVLLSD